MKIITNKAMVFILIGQFLFSAGGTALAQSYDDFDGAYFDDSSYVNTGNFGVDLEGYTFGDFDPSTPVSYNDFNNTYFNDGATYYGTTNCVGCGGEYSGYTFGNFDPSTPVSYNDFNNTYFNDGATYYGTTNCVGCDSYSYDYPAYTPPSWTGYDYDSYSYSAPSYTTPTYTYPTYTTPTYAYPTYTPPVAPVIPVTPVTVCSDGQPPRNGTCNRTTVIPINPITVCADGLAPVNGSCIRTNTIPVISNTICADGHAPVNGTCVRTNTLPVINNTICADGLAPVNGSCIRTNTIPVISNTICSDGSYPVNGSCVRTITTPVITYQTCWDGSVIPLTSICAPQYKVCANGTSVPVNQACYYSPAPAPYVPPVVIKFNNVITSVATEITLSSARCNGIGLIASNAPSTGWFEYGETANLGRETAKASIGSSATAPFSNMLANLKPGTTYYCRAVMNNQYGTVKGEIVAFKTKAKAVTYVKPVTQTTTTKKTVATKTASKKNEIVCSDGTTVSTGSKSSADLINNGQKLVSIQMEKVSGTLAPGSVVNYKLTFKNLSDETLRGMTVKATIPTEVTLMQASAGTYDPATRTLTATIPTLAAGAEGFVGWTGSIASSTQAGKSIAMTGYANYTVPGTNVQDEVTAYSVGQIVPATDGGATTTGAKKVVGASSDRGFLPNSLVEWLALTAIIFIIFILGRSVYTSYREEKVVH